MRKGFNDNSKKDIRKCSLKNDFLKVLIFQYMVLIIKTKRKEKNFS